VDKDYTPDLSIISRSTHNDNTMATRLVLENFPHSQHRPVVIDYGLHIPLMRSIPKPRWNFRRADWGRYADELDHIVQFIPPIMNNYDRFVEAVKLVAKKHIPRGFRKRYIPGWNRECEEL